MILLLFRLKGIVQKSMAVEITPAKLAEGKVRLSAEEKQWLSVHKVINFSVSHDWTPIAFISKSQKPMGISFDSLKKLQEIVGVKFFCTYKIRLCH